MGTLQRIKHSSDAAARDSISADSFSFAGLVSIQDQQHQNHSAAPKPNSDFEFSTTKTELYSTVANPFKITPADMLISNGQIKPHAIAFQPNRSFFTDPPLSLRSLLEIDIQQHINGETSSRARKYNEQVVKARNLENKERTETKTWFGHKVFKSLIAPCRKCEAVQPGAIKGQTVPQERY
ncbi:hypothetical protein L195_g041952 [Trifolium pratense]|uniref:Uncharacterized protein n=1 Tax=Trifolium pratense TaxID=57577 RepID=A0A2K3M518_TRIPR|nr:hypothetical protein L195_g031973 [Trifolium pratense]PNX85878.1 hypothetical protein L195_g041952 [Trifolium pratense]